MRERPEGLTDDDVARGLADGWNPHPRDLTFLPVGAGGYHWAVDDRWFVTVDARADHDMLARALGTAVALRQAGLAFVLAPLPDRDNTAARRLDARHSLSVYPLVAGESGDFGPHPPEDRPAVLDLLIDLHRTPPPTIAPRTDLRLPDRDDLEAALGDLRRPWTNGPYAEPARQALIRHASRVREWLRELDDLAATMSPATGWVVTHGEPHPGNILRTPDGPRLIDWDTARIAPLERDLWMLTDTTPTAADDDLLARYERGTGRAVSRPALAFYRLWWTLADLAVYAGELHRPHTAGADAADSLRYMTSYLD